MQIAFATIFDPRDIRRGSGTYYFLSKEIERQGHTVHYIGPLHSSPPLLTRVLQSLHRRSGRRYKSYLDPFLGRKRGREVSQQLLGIDYNLLLTNDFAIAAYTETGKPIVLYTDAMLPFQYNARYIVPYSRISNLSRFGVWLFQKTIRRGLQQSSLCVFPEGWIADEAKCYSAGALNVEVIPFGANIRDPSHEVADRRGFSEITKKGQIDLLFVGKDWGRKGGDIAVDTTRILREEGINAMLHAVGGKPDYAIDSDYVRLYGLLDKTEPAGLAQLDALYRQSDVFVFPSVSEGSVIVTAEAAAYGLPTLAYDVPGVRGRVADKKSGLLLAPNSSASAFAGVIKGWLSNPDSYNHLVKGARTHYETACNWEFTVNELIRSIVHLDLFI